MRRQILVLAAAVAVGCQLDAKGLAGEGDEDSGLGGSAGDASDSALGGSGNLGGGWDAGDAALDAADDTEAGTLLPYGFRRRISISAPIGLPVGYSVSILVDHVALVSEQKSLTLGDDLRIFHKTANALVEIDRTIDPGSAWNGPKTELWFAVQEPIPGPVDQSYYLYYGDPAAGAPPRDGSKVWSVWDEFDDGLLDPAWSVDNVGSASGSVTEGSGVLRIEGTTGDIWDSSDDFVFVHRAVAGNFVADTLVSGYGGSHSGWAKLGGVMIRDDPTPPARNRIMSPANGNIALTNSYRLSTGWTTSEETVSGSNPIPEYLRVWRGADQSRAWYSADGFSWIELGTGITFSGGFADPCRVGIPLANNTSSAGWVEVQWFRVRAWMNPEPTTTLEIEEVGPFPG